MQFKHDGCDYHWDFYLHCYSFWPTRLGFHKLGCYGSATTHLPGYSTEEFQALQLTVLVVFDAVD